MAKTSQFQFGIGRLIILVAALAVIMAVSIRLNVPQFAQWILAGYLAILMAWVVMRGPGIYVTLCEARKRRRQVKRRRDELEKEAAESRSSRMRFGSKNQ